MKNLLEIVRFKLVCLLINDSSSKGVENFFKNRADYWLIRYKAFVKDGNDLQKYCDEELGKYKKERDEAQDKYLELQQEHNMLVAIINRKNESILAA